MELSEKIHKLRKERGLTQEQFARQLFVSRTAVSKWETGRGMPSVESMQLIAKNCGITLDELLRADEILVLAEKESKENLNRFAVRVDGLIGIAALLCLFLPLYKLEVKDMFYSVPLYRLTGWLPALYRVFPTAMALCGIIQILLKQNGAAKLKRATFVCGFILNAGAVFVLILSSQPYPAVVFFALLLTKTAVLLMKQR